MNLISCDNCGVVLDLDKVYFPPSMYDENESWNGKDFEKKTTCGGEILGETK